MTEEPQGNAAVAGQLERGVRPAAEACPTCGSDCNERDELIKAEREIERLRAALSGELGPLPPTRVLDRHLPTSITLHGYNAEDMRAYALQERAAERARLRGYFRDALADTTITWPEEVAILYDKCFGLPSEPGGARHWARKAAS
jgi:hypothetical protein